MKKTLKTIFILSLLVSLFTGCDNKTNNKTNNDNTTTTSNTQSNDEMFTQRDYKNEYDESNSILIQLNGTSASASSDSVKISGTSITITQEATYIISGSLDNGMIIVDTNESAKLQIVLNNANITSKTSAPLYILEADKVFLTLANNSENTLSNGGTFSAIDENNIDGVIFSKQDLTINGNGSLTISSPIGHGIVCKDDLVFTGGTYHINCSSHGLDANDSIRISDNSNITINAGKDGLHCENLDDTNLGFIYILNTSLNIEAQGDGMSASGYIQIDSGTFNVLTGGGSVNATSKASSNYGGFMGGRGHKKDDNFPEPTTTADENSTSMKAMKASNNLLINNGTFKIDSADDCIHSDTSVMINGGSFEITSGDDAIHSENNLDITKGTINISKSYEGLEALHINIQGGDIKLIASDDGINAAGGNDGSGINGGRDGMFNEKGGFGISSNSDGSIIISGGTLHITSSGDGLDANGTIEISGGNTIVEGPTQGDTATLDYDISGIITGGTFIGTGASGMAQTFSDSKQGVFAVSVGNQNEGTSITLQDENGNTIITHTPQLSYAVVIISTPDIIKSNTYTITVGEISGSFEAY